MDEVILSRIRKEAYEQGYAAGKVDGYNLAGKAISSQQQWIPVSSGHLPKVGQQVLCQCREGIQVVLRLTDNDDGDAWECIYPPSMYMKSFVVAWMPLPEVYRGGGE